jgi:hypothetical protein
VIGWALGKEMNGALTMERPDPCSSALSFVLKGLARGKRMTPAGFLFLFRHHRSTTGLQLAGTSICRPSAVFLPDLAKGPKWRGLVQTVIAQDCLKECDLPSAFGPPKG